MNFKHRSYLEKNKENYFNKLNERTNDKSYIYKNERVYGILTWL
jgi:hypothetical protein